MLHPNYALLSSLKFCLGRTLSCPQQRQPWSSPLLYCTNRGAKCLTGGLRYLYSGGIIQHHCSGDYYDHAIQIIGYDLTGDVPYWRIRNTWGTDWGEDGFVRVLYGNKMCGMYCILPHVRHCVLWCYSDLLAGLNIEVTSVLKVNSVNLLSDHYYKWSLYALFSVIDSVRLWIHDIVAIMHDFTSLGSVFS